MPKPTKSKSSYKNQVRNPDGTFSKKLNKGKETGNNFSGKLLELVNKVTLKLNI